MESIIDYYVEVLNITLNDFTRPDVLKIAEKYDRAELGHLLQMILGKLQALRWAQRASQIVFN